MISLAKNILSKAPKNVLVGFGFGVGVGVGVLGTTIAASQNMSSRAHDAAKRAMANAEQAEAREKEALKRDWNENFNLIQQQRKHGPFVVPDKKKKRTKPANWGQKPNPNKEAKPVATKEEKALALADPEAEESPAKENAPVATMEKKVPVVKKEEGEEVAPVATKKKEEEEEAPAVATKEEEAPAVAKKEEEAPAATSTVT